MAPLRSIRLFARRVVVVAVALAACTPAFAAHRPAVGEVAPSEVGVDRDAKPIVLADYAGKVVVLSFWASWCGPCLKELPILEGIQKSAGKAQLQVIAINTESPEVYRQVARRLAPLELTVAHDWGKRAADEYVVKGIPHMVIIGRDGRIVKVHHGYNDQALDGIIVDINDALAAK